jgi:alpha-methylacyl-CoA racemase
MQKSFINSQPGKAQMTGPLKGIRIIEFVGIGPCPFTAMMLADMGAEVIRIDRKPVPGAPNPFPILGTKHDVMARGRRSITIDLKQPEGRALTMELIGAADAVLEGFRPGVMEKLGLGPEDCFARNPRLVYCRVTGWGQTGPLAKAAGHDLNYIALSGLLPSFGRPGTPPPPPLNLIGDFGAGGMMSAFGVVCGLLEARASGKGQVIDSAMLDGTSLMGAMVYGFHEAGDWSSKRGENWVDGGAHFYDNYECADGKLISIGPIEPQFYALLLKLCDISDPQFRKQHDIAQWPELKAKLAALFKRKTRQEWCAVLEGTDACFAPVLDLEEAPRHPQNVARHNFIDVAGVLQPAPAPRFSRTQPEVSGPPARPGEHSECILLDWGIGQDRVAALKERHII